MRKISLLSLLLPVAVASPLQVAAQTIAIPQGCEAFVTIQKRSCTVTHLFRCDADPEGWLRRVDYDADGMNYAGAIDSETQWIESFSPRSGTVERLMEGAVDPASFTELLETGRDGMDFATRSEPSGAVTIYRGYDILTGVTITIDGVTLDQTEFEVVAHDEAGNELWRTSGNEFIHREWRTFMSGTREVVTPTDRWDSDNTPVAFIFPGEAGYLSSTPISECGVMLSEAPGIRPDVASAYHIAYRED